MSTYEDLKAWFELKAWFCRDTEKAIELEKDIIKAAGGNKTAGRRVRKYMQQIRADAKSVRIEMMDYRKEVDEVKAQKKAKALKKAEANA
jgi:hypothetical protein